MQKIPTVFVRNPEDRAHVLPDVTPGCEWVLNGEGTPTRKWDGTCVMLDEHGAWWARREVKPGKNIPTGYQIVQHDETTGKLVGWEPIEQSPFHGSFVAAREIRSFWPNGTYELCGPKINGNPEGLERHTLIRHATAERVDPKLDHRTYDDIANFLHLHSWEGLVYHHPDGSMAKIKARDFR